MTTGADLVVEALCGAGIDRVFGLPGTTVMDLIDALERRDGIEFVAVRHEQSAAFMADGYARVTGRPGVCLASRGPGAANLAIGVHNAYAESIPVVALVGQVSSRSAHRDAFEEMDLVALFTPMTKHRAEPHDPLRLLELVGHGIARAGAGRPRPVMLSLPVDIQKASVAGPSGWRPSTIAPPAPAADAVERMAGRLLAARRPVIIAGGGTLGGEFDDHLLELADVLDAPVVTTWMRKNAIPSSHRCFAGSLGYGSFPETDEAVRQADVVLALGCRFSEFTTKRWTILSEATDLLHVDVDPAEIGRIYPAAEGAVADARLAAEALHASVRSAGPQRQALHRDERRIWLRQVCDAVTSQRLPPASESGGRVGSAAIISALAELQRLRPFTLVQDAASFGPWVQRYLDFDEPGTYHGAAGGSMGWGFPAALGMQAADAGRRILCVTGDGSFWMVAHDLETAVRERLAVIVVVTNNFSFGNTRDRQRVEFGGRFSGVFYGNPDFAEVARLLGAHGERVEQADQLVPALLRACDSGQPAVVDVVQDEMEGLPPDLVPLPT